MPGSVMPLRRSHQLVIVVSFPSVIVSIWESLLRQAMVLQQGELVLTGYVPKMS